MPPYNAYDERYLNFDARAHLSTSQRVDLEIANMNLEAMAKSCSSKQDGQPITVMLIRDKKGNHSWQIKVKAKDQYDATRIIDQLSKELLKHYGPVIAPTTKTPPERAEKIRRKLKKEP